MSNPNDDPDVISGLCDDAKKEMATTPGPSHGDHSFEDEASPSPTSRTSASPASRTLAKADDEEPGLTVEAPAPAAKTRPPTPPPARLGAPGSPGQQDHMEVLSDEGPPTSPPVNGSERMQVDDSRTNRTYHSTDETMPLQMSPSHNFLIALPEQAPPTSDLARHEVEDTPESSGKFISPVQLENSNRDEFGSPREVPAANSQRDFELDFGGAS